MRSTCPRVLRSPLGLLAAALVAFFIAMAPGVAMAATPDEDAAAIHSPTGSVAAKYLEKVSAAAFFDELQELLP